MYKTNVKKWYLNFFQFVCFIYTISKKNFGSLQSYAHLSSQYCQ